MKLSRSLLFLSLFTILIVVVSCGPGVEYDQSMDTGVKKLPGCPLEIYMPDNVVPPQYHQIGSVYVGENLIGTSMDCDRNTVLNELKRRACAEGADAVHIYEIIPPSWVSTCFRMRANFYIYNDPRARHPANKQAARTGPPSVKPPVAQQAQQKLPSLTIEQLATVPSRIPRGTRFKIEVQFLATGMNAGKSFPVELNYHILRERKVLHRSKPKIVKGENDILTSITIPQKAATTPGSYQLEVVLKYGETMAKKTARFTIE